MREKAGFTDSLLTESMLKEMFQVDLKDQTLRTMKVEIRELSSVPDSIAKFYDVPWVVLPIYLLLIVLVFFPKF